MADNCNRFFIARFGITRLLGLLGFCGVDIFSPSPWRVQQYVRSTTEDDERLVKAGKY